MSNLKEQITLPFDYIFNVDYFMKIFEDNHVRIPDQRLRIKEIDEISVPIKNCEDIHDQWNELMRIFQNCGKSSTDRYLFLEDYIDYGSYSLEIVCVLFTYKIKYRNRIYLSRRNHESKTRTRYDLLSSGRGCRAQIAALRSFLDIYINYFKLRITKIIFNHKLQTIDFKDNVLSPNSPYC